MTNQKFNVWNAYVYELIIILRDDYNLLKVNKTLDLILLYCKPDWVLWKVERTLKQVDIEINKIHKYWNQQEAPKFEYIEHEPDGSKAQELLGGSIEIKSTFKRN